MKITVDTDGVHIKMWLPNSLLKSRILMMEFLKKAHMPEKSIENIVICVKGIYKSLKKYVKQYGHFTFIEVLDSEASHIVIKL